MHCPNDVVISRRLVMTTIRQKLLAATTGIALLGIAACGGASSNAQGAGGGCDHTDLRFAYEGPTGTAQEIAANIFQKTLESNSDFHVAQYPGAQLGGEPDLLQKIRTGDIDFIISSTANAASLAPASGVFSLHYLFANQDEVIATVQDEGVNQAYVDMTAKAVKGAHPLTLFTLPLRNFYADFPIRSVADLRGKKIRVQATATEDTTFAAYGAQTVHMAFPELYTALQTGVVDVAENALTYYGLNKHYEVAPVMSISEHEGNMQVLWVSDKIWGCLSPEQQGQVTQAAMAIRSEEPAQAFALEKELKQKYTDLGVQFVEDVDKQSFQEISVPLQDKLANGLGPDAVAILAAVRKVTNAR
jgi:TRAP-type C4-dicarboxylate transport system substrate-binding protein